MNEVIITLMNQVLIMFAIMMIGFVLYKFRIVDTDSTKAISCIVLYIATPATIFTSFLASFRVERLVNGVWAIGLSAAVLVMSILFVNIVFLKSNGLTKFGIVFNNVGFLGIPLVRNVLGEESVFYMSLYVTMISFLVWTYGIYLVSGNKNEISISKVLRNPTIIMIAVGLIVFCLSIPIPSVISMTATYLGNLNAPLAMMVLGCYLAESNLKDLFRRKQTYIICAGRLLVIPALTLLMLHFVPSSLDNVRTVILIGSATPVAGLMGIFCQKYGNDYAYGAGVVGLSTLLSLITMPIFLWIFFLLG